jgi:hypothetical protein
MTPILNFTSGFLTGVSGSTITSTTARKYTFVNGLCTNIGGIIPGAQKNQQVFSFVNGILVGVSGSVSGSSSGSITPSGSSMYFDFISGTEGWVPYCTSSPTSDYCQWSSGYLQIQHSPATYIAAWRLYLPGYQSGSSTTITFSYININRPFSNDVEVHYTDGGYLGGLIYAIPPYNQVGGPFTMGPTTLHSNVFNNNINYIEWIMQDDGLYGLYSRLLWVQIDNLIPPP